MEENTSLWNKKASDLTVKDQLIVSLAIPAVMAGGIVAMSVVLGTADKVSTKFRNFRNRNKTSEK